jgi:hypothetical protein
MESQPFFSGIQIAQNQTTMLRTTLQCVKVGMCSGKILPSLVLLTLLQALGYAESTPGFVNATGRKINREDKLIQYILPDPGIRSSSGSWSPLQPETRLRPIEPFRTIRGFLPDGRLSLHNGRTISLRGCRFTREKSLEAWEERLKGKIVRLVFEEETHNASGELSAFVFLSDQRLLNEVLIREGLYTLDRNVRLSPQYRLRFEQAEGESFRNAHNQGIDSKRKTTLTVRPQFHHESTESIHPEPSQYRRGFTGFSLTSPQPQEPGEITTPALGGQKRAGENQSP